MSFNYNEAIKWHYPESMFVLAKGDESPLYFLRAKLGNRYKKEISRMVSSFMKTYSHSLIIENLIRNCKPYSMVCKQYGLSTKELIGVLEDFALNFSKVIDDALENRKHILGTNTVKTPMGLVEKYQGVLNILVDDLVGLNEISNEDVAHLKGLGYKTVGDARYYAPCYPKIKCLFEAHKLYKVRGYSQNIAWTVRHVEGEEG